MKKHINTVRREKVVKYLYSYLLKDKYTLNYSIDFDDDSFENFTNILKHRDEFDEEIGKRLKKWSIKELNPVILAILYESMYEIKYLDVDIPIIINDALNLSKEYSDIKAKNFVHGILADYTKEENE